MTEYESSSGQSDVIGDASPLTPPYEGEFRPADDDRSPASASLGLLVAGLSLLAVIGSIVDLWRIDGRPVFGEQALDSATRIRHVAALALGDELGLAVALGIVVVGFLLSEREGLAPLERVALLVIAGISGALAAVTFIALILDLRAEESLQLAYQWHSRGELAVGAATCFAIAATALGVAQRLAGIDTEEDEYLDRVAEDMGADGAPTSEPAIDFSAPPAAAAPVTPPPAPAAPPTPPAPPAAPSPPTPPAVAAPPPSPTESEALASPSPTSPSPTSPPPTSPTSPPAPATPPPFSFAAPVTPPPAPPAADPEDDAPPSGAPER